MGVFHNSKTRASFFFGATMSKSFWNIFERGEEIRNGWLIKFSDEHNDIDYGLCGSEESVAFFDIDEVIRAVKMISPDNEQGFKKADLDKLVSWIESREGLREEIRGDTIYGSNDSYRLSVFHGSLRREWSSWGDWETLEKSANKD
jgi:hypothetical protein